METTETVKGTEINVGNATGCTSIRGKTKKHEYIFKCAMGHRWGTCLCCTFRFDDVWMLSKLLLEEKKITYAW